MEEVHRQDSDHLHSDRYANQIKLCINLLDRIIKDDYLEASILEHDKYWGESHHWTSPTENPDFVQLNSARPNVRTPEDMALERKQFRKCMEHEQYLINQDTELLFKTIKKYHRHWWC